MPPKTLAALKDSIAHWERLASGKRNKGEEVSVYQCALCARFNTPIEDYEEKCVGCPIYDRTKQRFCHGTPFVRAEILAGEPADEDSEFQPHLDTEEFLDAAEKELEFLKSLLPK